MAKKQSVIKDVVETVESWVGMGPKVAKAAKKKTVAAKPVKKATTAEKAVKKKKKGTRRLTQTERDYDR
jgi:hypothetical protein